MASNLRPLFNPHSIAVVGVSSNPEKLGSIVYHNIIDAGYKGSVYPVNPKYDQVYNTKCYDSIASLPSQVELLCIVVPTAAVLEVMIAAGKKGIKACIIITAGFAELGEAGKKLEQKISEVARVNDMILLGPNCLGLQSAQSSLNASFAASAIQAGTIGFLSQSGACCTAMLDMAQATGLGFAHFVSLGNKAGISELDLIPTWLKDDRVKVLGAYLEEVDDGRKLISMYQQAAEHKPCVILKAGQSSEGQAAIHSHTGSLAGNATIVSTALAQHGITQVDTLRLLFQQMMVFAWAPPPSGNKVAVLTNAGGPGILTTDELVSAGFELAELTSDTKNTLKHDLPPTASVQNPVDIIGDAKADRYKAALFTLSQAPEVDIVLVLLTPQLMTQVRDTAQLIVAAARKTAKPIIPVFIGGSHVGVGLQWLWAHQIPAMTEPSDAVTTLRNYLEYQRFLKRQPRPAPTFTPSSSKLRATIQTLAKPSSSEGTKPIVLDDPMTHRLAEEFDIPLPRQTIIHSLDDGLAFADHHYPVVLKLPTAISQHKTEKKGVELNLTNQHQLTAAYARLVEAIDHTAPTGLLIQEQLTAGAEIFLGVQRDGSSAVYSQQSPGFGHHLTIGQGGIYTEIYADVAHVLLPATQDKLLAALQQTKVYQILKGARGKQPLAYYKLLEVVTGVQKMVLKYPEISQLDINPILVTSRRAVAVDLKIYVAA